MPPPSSFLIIKSIWIGVPFFILFWSGVYVATNEYIIIFYSNEIRAKYSRGSDLRILSDFDLEGQEENSNGTRLFYFKLIVVISLNKSVV